VEKLKENATVYISGLTADTDENQLQEYFGQLGVVKRQKQKRGYPDQWPFKIKV
jgi:RNA recognition motif-containing protein